MARAGLLSPSRFRLFPARSALAGELILVLGAQASMTALHEERRVWVMSLIREGLGPLMSRKEAARYLTERGLQIAPQTLARKFTEGTGPLCTSLNRRAMYYKGHLELWFREQLAAPRRSSSAPREPARSMRASPKV
jgi:hypothetical protein